MDLINKFHILLVNKLLSKLLMNKLNKLLEDSQYSLMGLRMTLFQIFGQIKSKENIAQK